MIDEECELGKCCRSEANNPDRSTIYRSDVNSLGSTADPLCREVSTAPEQPPLAIDMQKLAQWGSEPIVDANGTMIKEGDVLLHSLMYYEVIARGGRLCIIVEAGQIIEIQAYWSVLGRIVGAHGHLLES